MTGPRRVAVLAPMRSELRPVVRALGARRHDVPGSTLSYTARAGDTEVVAAIIGVGPHAAMEATFALLEGGHYDHVMVSGICGGIGPAMAVGDLITPAAVEDLATGRCYAPAPVAGHTPSGTIATTHELITDMDRVGELAARGVVALDMETSSVGAACDDRGVPWSVFRVVSDRPQDGLLDDSVFELLERDGSVNVPKALLLMVRHPGRFGQFLRLGLDAAGAARRAAREAVAAARSEGERRPA